MVTCRVFVMAISWALENSTACQRTRVRFLADPTSPSICSREHTVDAPSKKHRNRPSEQHAGS